LPEAIYLDAVMVGLRVSPCGGEKKIKKLGWRKILLRGGRKNTLLQALVLALPCAACKSVFFVRWLSSVFSPVNSIAVV
jgi:hypothetical protein